MIRLSGGRQSDAGRAGKPVGHLSDWKLAEDKDTPGLTERMRSVAKYKNEPGLWRAKKDNKKNCSH